MANNMKQITPSVFLDPKTKEIRFLLSRITEEGFTLHLLNSKSQEIAKRDVKIPALDEDEKPTQEYIIPTSVIVHQNSSMMNVVVEIESESYLIMMRFTKADVTPTSDPIYCPFLTKRDIRVNNSYCALQLEIPDQIPKYALFIISFDTQQIIRPRVSVDHKLTQIALSKSAQESTMLFFLEHHSQKYHLVWVSPREDWNVSKKTMILEELNPLNDAVIHLETYDDLIVILTQERSGPHNNGSAIYKILVLKQDGNEVIKQKFVSSKFDAPIGWDVEEPGILLLKRDKEDANYAKYAWVDLKKTSKDNCFDGRFETTKKPFKISFLQHSKTHKIIAYCWTTSSSNKIVMEIWRSDGRSQKTVEMPWPCNAGIVSFQQHIFAYGDNNFIDYMKLF